MTADAASFSDVERCVDDAAAMTGRLDGIVNCAGSLLLKPAHLTTAQELQDVLTANLVSAFATVRAGASAMRSSGGSIVLMSSAAAAIGVPNHEAIAAAKAGVSGLMRSAAASYAPYGIRVNSRERARRGGSGYGTAAGRCSSTRPTAVPRLNPFQ